MQKAKKKETEVKKSRIDTWYAEMIKGETVKFEPPKRKTPFEKSEKRIITPAEAKYILKYFNTKNRGISIPSVSKYASDMTTNNWVYNRESIYFDHTGRLLNGQTRLLAVIKSETPVLFKIEFGADPVIFMSLDGGRPRTNGHHLGLLGYDNPTQLSSFMRTVIAYEKEGQVDTKKTGKRFEGSNQISINQIKDRVEDEPEITGHMKRYTTNVVNGTISAFVSWLLSAKDPVKAQDYLEQVLNGERLNRDSQNWALYQKLDRNKRKSNRRMSRTEVMANLVIGWNRFLVGRVSNYSISWDEKKHKFPTPNS